MSGPDCSAKQYIQADQIDGLIAVAGVDGARDILDAFWRSTNDLVAKLDIALAAHDFGEAAALAHALKGSAGNVGADAICVATKTLELCCKSEDAAACESALSFVKADVKTTSEAFAAHFENAEAQVA